jgi:hypothetical protein
MCWWLLALHLLPLSILLINTGVRMMKRLLCDAASTLIMAAHSPQEMAEFWDILCWDSAFGSGKVS